MIYRRRYLQFNNLVFDNYEMLIPSTHNVDFKGDTEEYSHGHGSYAPIKGIYAKEQNIPLSITLKMKKIPCEFRPYYKQFAIKEITTPGRLWAIENNELLWAYAKITSFSEDMDVSKDEYRMEADFLAWEGVWHKADKLKTFLIPYNVCDFMDCLKYKPDNPCDYFEPCDVDCCDWTRDMKMVKQAEAYEDCCCCCSGITEDMALCKHDDLQVFYKECTPSYQIAYSCQKADEFFCPLGAKICTKDSCSNVIAGHFYSSTEIPTDSMDIVIDGTVHDVQITINGNRNVIKGDYEGLEIHSNGDVYSDDGCCKQLLEPEVWLSPYPNSFGWELHQGENNVVIDRGTCCGRACVYINADNLTI